MAVQATLASSSAECSVRDYGQAGSNDRQRSQTYRFPIRDSIRPHQKHHGTCARGARTRRAAAISRPVAPFSALWVSPHIGRVYGSIA